MERLTGLLRCRLGWDSDGMTWKKKPRNSGLQQPSVRVRPGEDKHGQSPNFPPSASREGPSHPRCVQVLSQKSADLGLDLGTVLTNSRMFGAHEAVSGDKTSSVQLIRAVS